jgi:structural maintenance of chromosome 4
MQDFIAREKSLQECEYVISESKETLQNYKTKRHDEFMAGLNYIAKEVKAMYQLITNGGDAELEIKDNLDPFAEGILY